MDSVKERKSFICELNQCKKFKDSFIISNQIFNQVWLQGLVLKLNRDEDYLILDDATGRTKIESCKRMPKIWENIKEGDYVLVICNLLEQKQTFKQALQLQTVKIQIINEDAYLELCWPLEVFEANFQQ